MPPRPIRLGGPLSIEHVSLVARADARVSLTPAATRRITDSRAVVEAATRDGQAHYGINTGFGSLSQTRVPADQLRDLQRNLVRSHAAGVGPPLPAEVVRATMLLLAASLARGNSGVRPVVVRALCDLLNAGITPVVPEVGSVGASGDLAPLAHIALVLIGEGQATTRAGRTVSGARALADAGLRPLALDAKEGLALINGTHLMAARAALLCHDASILFESALSAAAMCIDACKATDAFLDPRVYVARNQPGPAYVASRLRQLLRGSRIVASHRRGDPRVQDPYSLRCAPAVLGAAWDALRYVESAVTHELGAVTDNPLVFAAPSHARGNRATSGVVSAGNFHGMPLAIPLDTLAIALSHLAGIAERRIYFLLAATDRHNPLPAYLSPKPGLHSGLMIAQYTAAACCNEIVGLAAPASVANIPTSAGMEDYNSFGPRAAAKAQRALDLARRVVAVEFLCAAQAIDHHRPLRSGTLVERAHAAVRRLVPTLTVDRPLTPDIERLAHAIADAQFISP